MFASDPDASLCEVPTIAHTASEYIDAAALSADRAAAYRRLLSEIERTLGPMPVHDIAGLAAFLDAKLAAGSAPNTVRKYVWMLRAYYKWAFEHGHVRAETYLDVRQIKPPQASTRSAQPQRYMRTELVRLRAILDQRWPKMSEMDELKYLLGVKTGRTPYSRVRRHVIRCQVDAVIALALHLGLRRAEIFALDVNDVHHYNNGVVVRGESDDSTREVPFTNAARHAVEQWLACRMFFEPSHDRAWLNLHSARTKSDPMSRDVFEKLLATYVGRGWTLKRLRDTAIAGWVRAGLPLEHVRALVGVSSIEQLLPHARLMPGSLDGRMHSLDAIFTDLVTPVEIPGQAENGVSHAHQPGSTGADNGSKDVGDPAVPSVTVQPVQSSYEPHGRAVA